MKLSTVPTKPVRSVEPTTTLPMVRETATFFAGWGPRI